MEERNPTNWYLWISRGAGFIGLVWMLLGLAGGREGAKISHVRPSNSLLAANAAFLVAIWAVLYELRDRGIVERD